DLLCPPGIDELGGLLDAARVVVRAVPDLLSLRVVEHHALAHRGRAHRAHLGRDRTRCGQGLLHALGDQRPVRRRVENLRARHPWGPAVAVLALADSGLTAVRSEQHSPGAARAYIYGQ